MTSLALLVALTASASDKPVVSVLYFENRSGGADLEVMRKGFADMIITDLVAWDGVTVVERGRLEAVLSELELQKTKAFDKSTAVKVGKLIGAEYAITGAMNVAQGKLRVDANVTRISKGDVVASATATDAQDKVFDIEQQLVDTLTQAIDLKVKNREARKKAKVPSFEALVAYSKAIDLSDQGKVDEAQKAMAAVVSKSPTFLMARERKQQLLEKLKEFEARKKELITGAALELGRRADQELDRGWAAAADKKAWLFWRALKARFLARVLKQHLSSRAESLRLIKKGQEPKALEAMKAWAENHRRFLDEALQLQKLEPGGQYDWERADVYPLVRDSAFFSDEGPNFDPEIVRDWLYEFLIKGRVSDGTLYTVAPPLSVLVPAEEAWVLEAMADDAARLEAAYVRSSDKTKLEWGLARTLLARASMLEYLRRDDDAAAGYQKVLDLLPTSSDAKRAEERIQVIIGTTHEHARGEREKYEKALRDCDDWYVNTEAGWRVQRKGLAGLDEIAADLEKACFGVPRSGNLWSRFYMGLASDAAQHEDCERAKKFYLKAFTFGNEGPRSFAPYFKNEPWCDYGLTEATFPTKVRVTKTSFGTRGNQVAEALAEGLEDLIAEELGARGVAIEWGGSSNGGVAGLWVSLEAKEKRDELTLTGRFAPDQGPEVALSVPVKGRIDLDAFFAPALKVMKGRSDPGPRKPTASMPVDQAAGYGRAMELFGDQKWKEAQAAFDALAKKYPGFRLAQVRARQAENKQKGD